MNALSSLPLMDLDSACDALLQGSCVLFPTETFYGLGCDSMNADAVASVFRIKGRAHALPLPVVVASRRGIDALASSVPALAERLMDAFWPGPLSLVLPARKEIPALLTAGTGRVALRLSPHPAVLALCQASGKALVASSANPSGRPPVTRPEDLDEGIVRNAAGVYCFGPEPAGALPSTVVDIHEGRVRVLRQGAVGARELRYAGFTVEIPE